MARRGLPLALVLLMLFSLTIGQVAAQSDPDKQPSTERPTMYLWGDAALQSGNCFNHFASDGETQTGFGESTTAQKTSNFPAHLMTPWPHRFTLTWMASFPSTLDS